jgi:hypothetical protein
MPAISRPRVVTGSDYAITDSLPLSLRSGCGLQNVNFGYGIACVSKERGKGHLFHADVICEYHTLLLDLTLALPSRGDV